MWIDELPARVFAFMDEQGGMKYVLTLESVAIYKDATHVRIPFEWQAGPEGVSSEGDLKISFKAASRLEALDSEQRDRMLNEAIRRKYVLMDAFFPVDGSLLLTSADLAGLG
jgi:hypothetical protein